MILPTIVPLLAGAMLIADASPPQVTWEWYEAAETYQNYKVKGKDDLRIAVHYLMLAARLGNSAAAYKLGEAFEAGNGVAKDLAQALVWYGEAAARGDKYAELRIGWFHQKGLVTAPDPIAAITWYEKAAAHQNIWAFHMLAVLYAEGEGVPRDIDKAKRYFEISLPETHDGWAMWRLAQIVRPTDPDRAQALVKAAAKAGTVQALEELRLSDVPKAPRR